VIPNAHGCQQVEEVLALLKILALGRQQIAAGRVVPLEDAIARVESRRRASK
jgi:hypothetical protein